MPDYTLHEKRAQLKIFIHKVRLLCGHLQDCEAFSANQEDFRSYGKKAEALIRKGFCQADLKELSLSVQPIINLHKDWIPPMIETDSGLKVPDYYSELDKLHDEVMEAAFELKVLGTY